MTMGAAERKKWLFALLSALFISLLLFLSIISGLSTSYDFNSGSAAIPGRGLQYPPSFAYYIYGGGGDKERILRLLLAVYHPRNRYLLHLSSEASGREREWLAAAVKSVPAVRAFGNVDVIGKPIWLTYMGATNIAATLRAAAILLKLDGGWDWFITLSASDYPLLTQDGFRRPAGQLVGWWSPVVRQPRGTREGEGMVPCSLLPWWFHMKKREEREEGKGRERKWREA